MRAHMGAGEVAMMQAGSGPEAMAYLKPPEDTEAMADRHVLTALRIKMGCADVIERTTDICQNTNKNGSGCALRDDNGRHAMVCQFGGGVVERHDELGEQISQWLHAGGIKSRTEQFIPEWDRVINQGTLEERIERARLGVVYTEKNGVQACMDVSLVVTGKEGAATNGNILAIREKKKHQRYVGAVGRTLIPFVVDTRGRWGTEALAWVKGKVKRLPPPEQKARVADLRWRIAKTLQEAVAEQCWNSMTSIESRRQRRL